MTTQFSSRSEQRPHHENQSTNSIWSIFVGNISYETNEGELRSFFDKACNHVSTVRIIYDNQTQQSCGFAFVQFDTLTAYDIALTLNGSSLNGRKFRISPKKSRSTFPSTASSAAVTEPVQFSSTKRQKTRVVHCRRAKYDVYIGRPSIWGNPFVIGRDGDKADRLRKYREWIISQPQLLERAKRELRGRTIACWCKPEACHGDILAEIADAD